MSIVTGRDERDRRMADKLDAAAEKIDAHYERVRLLGVELAGIQEAGDILVRRRQDTGVPDEQLEGLMVRLARARERLQATPGFDRSQE